MSEPVSHEEAIQYAHAHPESNLARCYLDLQAASDHTLLREAETALQKGRELSSWVGSINWRGGENLQPWLDDLSEKMTAFDAARADALDKINRALGD